MRFLFFALLILPLSFLSANDQLQTNYNKGLEAYKSKDYKTSYDLWKSIYLQKLSDINFNFLFGRSAFETGNYETALAAFERVGFMDETNTINKLETAKTYFMLKMYESAELIYKEILENSNTTDSVKKSVEISLSNLSNMQKKSYTYATIGLDILYDSNVNYGSINDYNFNNTLFNRVEPLSDLAIQAYGNIVNIYNIDFAHGFAIKNSFSAYMKDYNTYNQYNILYFSYSPSFLYKNNKYTAELIAGFDLMELNKEKYLTSFSLTPRFELSHTKNLKSIFHLRFQEKSFEKVAQKELDSKRYEFHYGLQSIPTPRSFLQGNLIFAKENKEQGNNLYVNFKEYKANLTYAKQLDEKYSVNLYGELRDRKYQDFSGGFNNVRQDISATGRFSFNINITKNSKIKLAVTYDQAKSNQDSFSYRKRTTSLGFLQTF